MNKKQYQSGSAHLAVIIVLVLALIGALGFVFYQNFIQDKGNAANVANKTSVESKGTDGLDKINENSVDVAATKYNTFNDEAYGISFKYPEKWTLGEINIKQPDMPYWNRSIDVKNENEEKMATLVLGVSGLGGTCSAVDESDIPSYTVLDSELSSIKANSEVAMHFTVHHDESQGKYSAYYGLSDTYTSKGDFEHVCLFYNHFNSEKNFGDNIGGSISFGNGATTYNGGKEFASLEDVNKYLASDEYKEIKKMILSLTIE